MTIISEPRRTASSTIARPELRARMMRGWTQEQAAEKLAPYMEEKWSKATLSAAERSVAGSRIRRFTADQIVAIGEQRPIHRGRPDRLGPLHVGPSGREQRTEHEVRPERGEQGEGRHRDPEPVRRVLPRSRAGPLAPQPRREPPQVAQAEHGGRDEAGRDQRRVVVEDGVLLVTAREEELEQDRRRDQQHPRTQEGKAEERQQHMDEVGPLEQAVVGVAGGREQFPGA